MGDYEYDAEVERQAAAALHDGRDARVSAAYQQADRRAGIARDLLAGYLAGGAKPWEVQQPSIQGIIRLADELMQELDSRLESDLSKARS